MSSRKTKTHAATTTNSAEGGAASSGRPTVYDIITERICAQLEKGTVPWLKPWKGGDLGAPKNLASGKPYRGVNVLCGARHKTFYAEGCVMPSAGRRLVQSAGIPSWTRHKIDPPPSHRRYRPARISMTSGRRQRAWLRRTGGGLASIAFRFSSRSMWP